MWMGRVGAHHWNFIQAYICEIPQPVWMCDEPTTDCRSAIRCVAMMRLHLREDGHKFVMKKGLNKL